MYRSLTRLGVVTAVTVAAIVLLSRAAQGRCEVCGLDSDELLAQVPIIVDYTNPPSTWPDAVKGTDLVAVVRLSGRTYPQTRERELPKTKFRAEIIEVIGGPHASSAGREIAVSRFGGVKQIAGAPKLVEQRGFPAWKVGATCLVFLKWSEPEQSYVLPFGPDSVFELDPTTNKASTPGHGRLARSQRGRPFADVLTEVRAAGR